MNEQIPLPKITTNGLLVHSIFPTIQCEGPFAGFPAVFIRLAGCNLQCKLCDTEYTQGAKWMSLGEVVSLAESYQYDLIVITGGEPFRQSRVIELSALLINRKKTVQFETNGTISDGGVPIFSFLRPYIICSPKTPKVSRHLLPYITHWKYLVRAGEVDPDDGLPSCISINFSDQKPARPQDCSKYDIFLCPLDEGDPEKNKANLEAAALSCLKFGYRLSTQIHKMIPHLLP